MNFLFQNIHWQSRSSLTLTLKHKPSATAALKARKEKNSTYKLQFSNGISVGMQHDFTFSKLFQSEWIQNAFYYRKWKPFFTLYLGMVVGKVYWNFLTLKKPRSYFMIPTFLFLPSLARSHLTSKVCLMIIKKFI